MYRVTLSDEDGTVIHSWDLADEAKYIKDDNDRHFPNEPLSDKTYLLQSIDVVTDELGDMLTKRIEAT